MVYPQQFANVHQHCIVPNRENSDQALSQFHHKFSSNSNNVNIIVYARNARIGKANQLSILLSELDDLAWDVLFVSEAHSSTEICIIGDGHQLISTLDTDKDEGVVILMSKKRHSSIRQIHRVSVRVMADDCMIGETLTRLISIYFPHSSKPGAAQLLDDCYHQLFSLLDAAHHRNGNSNWRRFQFVIGLLFSWNTLA